MELPYTIEIRDSFNIIGLATKTTNENGKSAEDMGLLWKRFFSENIPDLIPDKTSFEIFNLYTDYEGNLNAPYTYIIGCKVANLENIPEGLIGKHIPEGKYVKFQPVGKLPELVLDTWDYILKQDFKRNYRADYDIYGVKASNPRLAEIEVCVSVD